MTIWQIQKPPLLTVIEFLCLSLCLLMIKLTVAPHQFLLTILPLGSIVAQHPNRFHWISGRSRMERPTIVDYGHDEAALSHEAEEGELVGTGCVTFAEDLHMSNGEYLEQTSQGTLLTPSTQAIPPQSSGQHSLLQLEGMECFVTESVYVEETVKVSLEEPKDVDPLDKFLLP